jgi:GTP cyclohydrolase I
MPSLSRICRSEIEHLNPHCDNHRELCLPRLEQKQLSQIIILETVDFSASCAHWPAIIDGSVKIRFKSHGQLIGTNKVKKMILRLCQSPNFQQHFAKNLLACIRTYLNVDDIAIVIEATIFSVGSHHQPGFDSEFRSIAECGIFKTAEKLN